MSVAEAPPTKRGGCNTFRRTLTEGTAREHRDVREQSEVRAAQTHPTVEFRSTGVRHEAGEWLLDGELTVRGKTRPVTLDLEFGGAARDPWENERVGISATTR